MCHAAQTRLLLACRAPGTKVYQFELGALTAAVGKL